MTLIISAVTSSGIILSADSRQTYKNLAGAIRIGSDSASKLFKLTDFSGVAISGKAFLSEEGQAHKNVGYFIDKFRRTEDLRELSVRDIAIKLNNYLSAIFVEKDILSLKSGIQNMVRQKGGKDLIFLSTETPFVNYQYIDRMGKQVSDVGRIDSINMIVAGTDKDKIGRAYSVYVPKGITFEKDTQQCGALWDGQTDVLQRIIKGFAPEVRDLDFVKKALAESLDAVSLQLNKTEYIINWGTMTLQDAVDFCVLMTRTTESIQRFSDGTQMTPGGIPGVGGEIDIAVISPEKGFRWLSQKKLKCDGEELCLDQS
jgi:hypothetical protein